MIAQGIRKVLHNKRYSSDKFQGLGWNVNLLPLPERLDAVLGGSDKKRLLVHPGDVDQAPAVVDGARVDRSSADA